MRAVLRSDGSGVIQNTPFAMIPPIPRSQLIPSAMPNTHSTKPSPRIFDRLQVAVDANAAAYRRVLQTSAPGDCWDFVVLTAANEKQAQGYRQELSLRHRAV